MEERQVERGAVELEEREKEVEEGPNSLVFFY